MINMGELFRYPRLGDVDMSLVDIDHSDSSRYLVAPGDLLFARRSLTAEGAGKCTIVTSVSRNTTWESSIIRARLDARRASPEFYYYLFRSPVGRKLIGSIVEQVAVAGIRSSDLSNLCVPCPPLHEQRATTMLLGALDDKIEVNERIAAIYEQLLQLQFDELGVAGELDPANTIMASELIEFNPKVSKPSTGEAVYVDMAALSTNRAGIQTWARRKPKSGTRFSNGDTLLARITPCLENGKTGFVDFMAEGEVGVGSTEFIVMRSRPGIPSELSYFLARNERFRAHAIRNMVGSSGRQRVSATDVADFLVNRPKAEALTDFGAAVSKAFAHMKSLENESRTLAALRDTLLPQLMSGRIHVRDAEQVVEDAL
ncbi:restriction endonuclease subunit S [Streptosporangium sp. 'caverna']|uniref:restriction endonuclease subunit S n=1 Tax=Streptosporangium sp. 'caverna' TaxID=2202249 RepID=UPI0013A6A968|nr:restriction endonuclease subunit S [Streptosporangium sp. 'caverna']